MQSALSPLRHKLEQSLFAAQLAKTTLNETNVSVADYEIVTDELNRALAAISIALRRIDR